MADEHKVHVLVELVTGMTTHICSQARVWYVLGLAYHSPVERQNMPLQDPEDCVSACTSVAPCSDGLPRVLTFAGPGRDMPAWSHIQGSLNQVNSHVACSHSFGMGNEILSYVELRPSITCWTEQLNWQPRTKPTHQEASSTSRWTDLHPAFEAVPGPYLDRGLFETWPRDRLRET